MAVVDQLRRQSRRRRRAAAQSHQRLDIQGLRMVAVLTVFAFHLSGWPKGGFVGVDVFFVISGFLITGNLLRMAETKGNVSFRRFYWNRVRRIVPAATVVLIATFIAAVLVFLPFRAHQVGIDAAWAFAFLSNWWFAVKGTDYFSAGDAVSPIQHYWSLSIEEQFYFVWPALIFVIGLLVARRALTHGHRMRLAGWVMTAVVVLSLGWSVYETLSSPTWAYFNTFARVWELGVGALLATAIGLLGRIPAGWKPILSWGGLGLIAASLVLLSEHSAGFPAPWALLPVMGSALVIAAGVDGEPDYQPLLRHPAAVYVGNISYSLYLVHWPLIVILAALMPRNWAFYATVVALTFGLSVASYHFIENPFRYGSRAKVRGALHDIGRGQFDVQRATQVAAIAALALVAAGLTAYVVRPVARHAVPPAALATITGVPNRDPGPQLGPLGAALQNEIQAALQATAWPPLDPSMESVINGPQAAPEVSGCGAKEPTGQCTFGSPTAATRIVLAGDSIAMTYANPLRLLALNSDGKIQVRIEAMFGCQFADDQIDNADKSLVAACPGRRQHVVDMINQDRPDVVVIANSYGSKHLVDHTDELAPDQWANSLTTIIGKFQASTKRVVLLAAPPADTVISECYGTKSSVPADCISKVTDLWSSIAGANQQAAAAIPGAVWVDSRPWFCADASCPAFVGTTPTKHDASHMAPAYGVKIAPVIGESLSAAGILATTR